MLQSTLHSTPRRHPFEIGHSYRCRESFAGFADFNFVTGRSYRLVDIDWSAFDACTIFKFADLHAMTSGCWYWNDDEPESLCAQRFEVSSGQAK